ncbi:MAG: DNA primase [Rikenellaceae bacterium]
MIDRETIDRIYAAANIVEVIGDYVTLKRKGVNYQACCPFHNEKTPSFVVSPSKGIYRCFGCGKGGSVVSFVMEHDGLSYPEALKVIAKKYGIEVHERELTEEQVAQNNNRESMFALNGWAYDYFVDRLTGSEEGRSVGLSYFRSVRGFTDATIKRFGLGFCPSRGSELSEAALKASYKEEFLVATGLSIKSDSDGHLFDRFRDRVIFPVHTLSGRVVAFGGRTLRSDKKLAKYVNSPESEIYSKKRELYGLFFAKKAIQQHDNVIMVEGYTDVISMHQSGIENVVSSSGTSLTKEQIMLIHRFTKNITIIYDGDAAGVKAALRGIDLVLSEGMNVRIVSLPPEHDPDSFARAHTAEQVQSYIRDNEVDFLSYKAKMLMDESESDPTRRAEMIGDMVESISCIPEPIRRTLFVDECAKIMAIDRDLLLAEVARKAKFGRGNREATEFIRNQQQQSVAAPKLDYLSIEAGSSVEILEFELLKYLLRSGHRETDLFVGSQVSHHNVATLIFNELEDSGMPFSNGTHRKIFDIYHSEYLSRGEGQEVATNIFLESEDTDVCNKTVDILTSDETYEASQIWRMSHKFASEDEESISRGVYKALTLYKSKSLDNMIKDLNVQLSQCAVGDDDRVDEILQNMAKLNSFKVQLAHQLKRLIL